MGFTAACVYHQVREACRTSAAKKCVARVKPQQYQAKIHSADIEFECYHSDPDSLWLVRSNKMRYRSFSGKDHIHLEHSAAKKWPENWGFLSELNRELAGGKPGAPKGEAAVRVKNRQEALKLPPIDQKVLTQLSVGKSSKSFPRTSSDFVGWRSAQPQCGLERYGHYTKPKVTFLHRMKWPPESIV